jgi:hypothetical protein
MRPSRHTYALTAMVFGLTLFSTGCETKVSQCNKLIAVANAATSSVKAVTQEKAGNETQQVAQMAKFADTLDKFTKDVQAVELKDEQLKGFQKRLIDLYSGGSKDSRAIVAAMEKKDLKAMQESLGSLMKGSATEGAIVGELNGYCGAK